MPDDPLTPNSAGWCFEVPRDRSKAVVRGAAFGGLAACIRMRSVAGGSS